MREAGSQRLLLWVMTAISGLAALVATLQVRETTWPKPFAWAWFVVCLVALVHVERARRARYRTTR